MAQILGILLLEDADPDGDDNDDGDEGDNEGGLLGLFSEE